MRFRNLPRMLTIYVLFLSFPQVALSESVSGLAGAMGITPENLAVAGWSGDEVEYLLERLDEDQSLTQEISEHAGLADRVAAEIERLQEQLTAEPDDDDVRTKLGLMRGKLVDLNLTQRRDLKGRIWALAIRGVAGDDAQQLRLVIAADQACVALPYRSYPFGEEEWEDFRKFVAIQKQCIKSGRGVPSEVADALDRINGDRRVVQARVAIDSRLEQFRQLFAAHV